jgi:hypothetical protein
MTEGLALPEVFARLEAAMVDGPPMQSCVFNHFPEGLYVRETHFAAGTRGTTMIHRFDHPFFLLKGDVEVISEAEGPVRYKAPHTGMTKAGTKRALRAHADCVWITVHPNPDNERDIDKIVARITIPYENPNVPLDQANQWQNNQTLCLTE